MVFLYSACHLFFGRSIRSRCSCYMPRLARLRTFYFGLRMLATSAFLLADALAETASADPYKWCAVYGGADNGGTNCYFMTLEQCRATVSGAGGFCQPNG